MDRQDTRPRLGEMKLGRDEENGWGEYKLLVLAELRRLSEAQEGARKETKEAIETLRAAIQAVGEDVIALKVKAAMWGAVAGWATGLLPYIVRLLR